MASTGQRCPLCSDSLLKFLFNLDGDYILNCSSRICLYGVLHAQVYRSDERTIAETSINARAAKTNDFVLTTSNYAEETAAAATTAAATSTLTTTTTTTASSLDEVPNQTDVFSSLQNANENSAFINMIDTGPTDDSASCPTTTATPHLSDSFPNSLDLSSYDVPHDDDDMINNWMKELIGASSDVNKPAEVTSEVPLLPLDEPMSKAPQVGRKIVRVQQSTKVKKHAPTQQSTRAVMKSTATTTTTTVAKTASQQSKTLSKVNRSPKVSSVGKTGQSRFQKSRAIASMLKSHLGANDDTPSEESSDSGIQSDASSDRSSNSSTLTPIQRLLHIEEAKKRSWGVTGMPGFKPSATKERRRLPAVY